MQRGRAREARNVGETIFGVLYVHHGLARMIQYGLWKQQGGLAAYRGCQYQTRNMQSGAIEDAESIPWVSLNMISPQVAQRTMDFSRLQSQCWTTIRL